MAPLSELLMNPALLLKERVLAPIYYLDRELWRLEAGRSPVRVAPAEAAACRTLVLAKPHYHEVIHAFPMTDPAEIKEAVTLDFAEYCPFEPELLLLRRLGRAGEGTLVNLWFVRPAVRLLIQQCNPWLLLPESALLASSLEPGTYRTVAAEPLLLQVAENRAVQSISAGSARDGRAAELFRRGLDRRVGGEPVPIADYPAVLATRLPALSFALWRPFLRWGLAPDFFRSRALRYGLGVMALQLLLYTVGWYALPVLAKNRLTTTHLAYEQEVGDLLERQHELERIGARYRVLSRELIREEAKLPLLNLLHLNLPAEVSLSRLQSAGRQVEIQGSAPSGSEVLAALAAAADIREAAFAAPLRRESRTDRDLFHIRFTYAPERSP